MKTKNIIPFLLILTLFSTNTFSDRIIGNITGLSMWPITYSFNKFDVNYSYTNSPNNLFVESSAQDPNEYVINLPENIINIWVIPQKEGYIFDPPNRFFDYVNNDTTDQDFNAVDTMPTEVILVSPIDSTWVVNTKDSLRFDLDDNSSWVKQYSFYYSIDSGSNYTLIATIIPTGTGYAPYRADGNPSSNPYSSSRKRLEFTPTELNPGYKIKFEAVDPDGNIGIGYSGIFAVIDTIKPTVQVSVPNGSEIWHISSVRNIEWTAADNFSVLSRVISISTDNGSNWTELDSTAGNSGSWPWTVTNTPSTECFVSVRVYDTCNNMQEDISDVVFTIMEAPDTIAPTVFVTAPVTGEGVQRGSNYDITWTATDNKDIKGVEKISLYLNTGSGYSKLDSIDSNPGTWSWSVPSTEHLNSTVRIYAYDAAGNQGEGLSGVFEIRNIDTIPPTTTVHQPIKGQIVYGDSPIRVMTESYDNFELAWISYYLSVDGGNTYTFKDSVQHSTINNTKFFGIPTDLPDAYDQCKIKVIVYDAEGNSVIGYSDSLFSVVDNVVPYMRITSPPDTIQSGLTHNIEWFAFDWVGVEHVLLYLSTDNGTTYSKLDSVNPDTSSYLWTIPQMNANCFLIAQAFDAVGLSASDTSTSFFIEMPVGIKPVVQKKLRVILTTRSILINMERAEKIPIKIFNIKGQPLYDKKLGTGFHKFPVEFAKGTYILQINNKSQVRMLY